jgi:hypothetical protein
MYANQSNRETSKGRIQHLVQTELLKLPHWDILLGTSKDNSEKMVGPKKARTNPKKN